MSNPLDSAAGIAAMGRVRVNMDYVAERLQKDEQAFASLALSPNPLASSPLKRIQTDLHEVGQQITTLRRVLPSLRQNVEVLNPFSEAQQRQMKRVNEQLDLVNKVSCLGCMTKPLSVPGSINSLIGCFAGSEYFCTLNTTCRDDPLVANFATTPDVYIKAVRENRNVDTCRNLFQRLRPSDKRSMGQIIWVIDGRPRFRKINFDRVISSANQQFHQQIATDFLAAKKLLAFSEKINPDDYSRRGVKKNAQCFSSLLKGDRYAGQKAQLVLIDACILFSGTCGEEESIFDHAVVHYNHSVRDAARRLGNWNLSLLPKLSDREALVQFCKEFTTHTHAELQKRFEALKARSPEAASLLCYAAGNQLGGDPSHGEYLLTNAETQEAIVGIIECAESIARFELGPRALEDQKDDSKKS